jgi:hypothetical protein
MRKITQGDKKITIGDVTIGNLQEFLEWYDSHSRTSVEDTDITALCDEAITQHCSHGGNTYELAAHESKSGHAEVFTLVIEEPEEAD